MLAVPIAVSLWFDHPCSGDTWHSKGDQLKAAMKQSGVTGRVQGKREQAMTQPQ